MLAKFLELDIPTPPLLVRAQLPHVMAGTEAVFSVMEVMVTPAEMVAMPVESVTAATVEQASSGRWVQQEQREQLRAQQAAQAEREQQVAPGAMAVQAEH
jgi:hypothetical protein